MSPHSKATEEKDQMEKRQASDQGVYIDELADGEILELETQHHHYTLEKRAGAQMRISGHPRFCPKPVAVEIEGSISDRPATNSRPGFIGRGMHLIFKHPVFENVTTSRIREIHKVA